MYSCPSVLRDDCVDTGVCFSALSIWERRPADGDVSSISKLSEKEDGLCKSRDSEREDVVSVGGREAAMTKLRFLSLMTLMSLL